MKEFGLAKFAIANLALRPVPTRIATGVLRRLGIDLRSAWDHERLYFLTSRPDWSVARLNAYYMVTPVGCGIAWGCAMEAAYRIFNLATAAKSRPDRGKILTRCIRKERSFILANLETKSANNHYLFNILGILVANNFLEAIDDERWLEALAAELRRQFLPDGTNFEGSSGYHLLVLEALAVASAFRPEIADSVRRNLNLDGALSFLRAMTLTEGRIWFVGDNDGSVCRWPSGGTIIRKFQLETVAAAFGTAPVVSGWQYFPDFGAAFHRNGDLGLGFWNPSPGQAGKAGHNHNDQLSLTLSIAGNPFIGDPGVFSYASLRDRFRSAASHSSPGFEGTETEQLKRTFARGAEGATTLLQQGENAFLGQFQNGSIRLSRRIALASGGDSIVIEDRGAGRDHGFTSRIILDPLVTVDRTQNGCVLRHASTSRKVKLSMASDINLSTAAAQYAVEYGELRATTAVVMQSPSNAIDWRIEIE